MFVRERKTRCSGTWPCTFCARIKLDCQFTAAYRRGQVPAIDLNPEASITTDASGDDVYSQSPSDFSPGNRPGRELVDDRPPSSSIGSSISADHHADGPTPPLTQSDATQISADPVRYGHHPRYRGTSTLEHSGRNSPEQNQTDQQGHYVGPASGVSFLLRVQRTLQKHAYGPSSSSTFTFGDLPLPGDRSPFAILPPRTQAHAMVRRYFGFAAATNHFLHRPTVEAWLEELYSTGGAIRERRGARSRVALLFMVFAFAINYGHSDVPDEGVALSTSEASETRYLGPSLSIEKGETSLTTVQVMLAQCFYLLAQSRLNHCWTVFGTASHLMLALGMHRKSRGSLRGASPVDCVEIECRKRTFWCAYTLNTYLSDILGRPMTFHDDDIDQDLPLDVDDSQIQPRQVVQPEIRGPSTMSASVAHHRLSQIQTRILRSLYGISTPSTERHFELADDFTDKLDRWREDIQYLFDADGDSSIFVRLVLRQRDVLRLTFWHSRVLVHRPFLLKTFANLAGNSHGDRLLSSRQPELERNVQHCLDAAVHIVQQIDRINAAGHLYSTLFSIPYYGFSAVVVLYVYAIRQRTELPQTYLQYFNDASHCHAQLERIASKGSMMHRYGIVLQELRVEVLRHNAYLASTAAPHAAGSEHSFHGSGISPSPSHPQGGGENSVAVGAVNRHSWDEALGDGLTLFSDVGLDAVDTLGMAGWGQFDTLISGSIGRLDPSFFEGVPGRDLVNSSGLAEW
ncbi:Fungal trans [Geosmithia morbida]|uniref:Fungal trans n=1 Tax=Geosmithia morbida TaxID=1094350 RepID=A0A9P5CYF7_9HYPO|nr:Fungal trans [Geosmithia morbida]KAF4119342.1 Fungal trans [Geosmithia morbida]